MKFQQFMEQYLQEAPSTHHGKVESALRSLNLNYKNDRTDTARAFYLNDGYIVMSYNSGLIKLLNRTKVVDKFQEFDDSKLIKKVTDMIEKHAPELLGKEKDKEKATT